MHDDTRRLDPTDAELIERIRSGDTGALDIVLQRYWPSLVGYLIRLTQHGDRDAAEDIAQRTFLQLWDHRHGWRLDGSLRGLLFRIARNFALSELRRSAAESRSAAVLAERVLRMDTPIEMLEGHQLRQELGRAIESLPERRREVFVLRCLHDLSYKEIAGVMGTSPQTVANQLSSALATLRRTLAHLLDY